MTMTLLPVGVGDAFSAERYGTCLALRAEGRWLLIDCPHPVRKMLREAGQRAGIAVDIPDFEAVVVTHLHADHASGLESYGFFSHFALRRPAKLVASQPVLDALWPQHLVASMAVLIDAHHHAPHDHHFADYFDAAALVPGEPLQVGPFTIESRFTIHHIPTTALRIRAGGVTIGISSDTAFDPGLIDWLSEADLILHETNFGAHTPYERLAGLPAELRARMRLFHCPDGFDRAGSVIACLEEGVPVEVEARQ